MWCHAITTRGGCLIELNLHLGNPAVGTDSSLSLSLVPVWRWFPKGTSGFSTGGTSTSYPATDEGKLQINLYFLVIMPYYNIGDISLIYTICRAINCILKWALCSMYNASSCVFLPAVTEGTSRSNGSYRATRPSGKALLWPWLNLHLTLRAPETFNLNFTFCLLSHNPYSLLPIIISPLCMLSMFTSLLLPFMK